MPDLFLAIFIPIIAILVVLGAALTWDGRRMFRRTPKLKVVMPKRRGAPVPQFINPQRKKAAKVMKHGRSVKVREQRIALARQRQGI